MDYAGGAQYKEYHNSTRVRLTQHYYAVRDDTGALPVDMPLCATGPHTAEWVRVRSIAPIVSGWVR